MIVSSCTQPKHVCLQLDAKGQPLEQPLELSFQDQYGDIERHLWFGDGYILLGFNTGHFKRHLQFASVDTGANREANSDFEYERCIATLKPVI